MPGFWIRGQRPLAGSFGSGGGQHGKDYFAPNCLLFWNCALPPATNRAMHVIIPDDPPSLKHVARWSRVTYEAPPAEYKACSMTSGAVGQTYRDSDFAG